MHNGKGKEIFQFSPSEKQPHYPGVYGWGFDTHGYRLVIYGPPEADHEIVRMATHKLPKHEPDLDDVDDHLREKVKLRRTGKKDRQARCPRGQEHGPAHVHVFDIKSGRETRFELIEHHGGAHTARPLYTSGIRDNALTSAETKAVIPILEKSAEDFIQEWRELYRNNGLSRYVTRISSYGGKEMEEIAGIDGWTLIKDRSGVTARIPPGFDVAAYLDPGQSHRR